MSILEPITRRLQRVVIRMDEYLTNQGVDTSEAKTIMDYVNLISEVPSGIQYVMEGYHLFKGNTEMTELPPDLHEERFTSMYCFCRDCTALTYVGALDTSNVTDFVYAFYGCTSLTEIESIDTSSAESVGEMFHNCSSLVRINSPLDVSNVTSQLDTTFTGCSNLVELRFTGTINVDIWLSGAWRLSVDSLLSALNALADLTGTDVTKKITLGARNKAKLTEEQLAIATAKGWTLG